MTTVRAVNDRRLGAHHVLAEPQLIYHPSNPDERHPHPLRGLIAFGPYSRKLPGAIVDPLRLAVISPAGERSAVSRLLGELTATHRPEERREYLPEYPGIERVFGVRAVMGSEPTLIELPQDLDERIAASSTPHLVLAEAVIRALDALRAVRSEFSVALVYLPDRWSPAFQGIEDEDFNLHHYLKAWAAGRGMATQVLNDHALQYHCRASIAWTLSIALYVKGGGIPWKLAGAVPGVAYVGLSYGLRRHPVAGTGRFVTCVSQVFDDDGGGLEFIAYDTQPLQIDGRNPFLSREEMRRVMARTLALYAQRHVGRAPDRLVVHKSTRFTTEEVEGSFDGLAAVPEVELLQVQDHTSWIGVNITGAAGPQQLRPDPYPVPRGALLPFDGSEALLWTSGNATGIAAGGRNYFKEGVGVPHPLLLRRFAGAGSWDETARSVLALTKMNWNNDALYDRLPTTMAYASVLADTVKRIDTLSDRPYPFHLFM
jgi:hypothetical protein